MKRLTDAAPLRSAVAAPRQAVDPSGPGVQTRQGWFSWDDLKATRARWWWDEDGGFNLVFPIRYEDGEPEYPPLGPEGFGARCAIAEKDGRTVVQRREAREAKSGRPSGGRRRSWEDGE